MSWSLTHGPWLLAAMAGVTGAIFTGHFRWRMVLRERARFASYVPSMFIPAASTAIAQQSIVYSRLLDMKSDCLLCSEISAMSAQLLFGVVQPYALSIFASAAVAKLTMVYPLPPITDIVGMYRTVRMLSQRLHSVALVAVAGGVVNAALVAHSQHKAVAQVQRKLTEKSIFIS